MTLIQVTRLLAVLSFFVTFLSSAVAQLPSNETLPQPTQYTDTHYYSLQTQADGSNYNFALLPLTNPAKLGAGQQVQGPLILSTPGLGTQARDIVCISCDPATYSSQNINATGTVSLALSNSPGAIVLFSYTSKQCNYTYDGDGFPVIYTMTTVNSSRRLLSNLQMRNSQGGEVVIKYATGDSNSPNGSSITPSGGNYDGHSPTTAVAMIILYSITGIITALFLIIIVVGAVRAHRHPERYGPRNMLGRPRQSRARGIARAMLETIPIVKFGEREENKPGQQVAGGDVELGPTTRDATTELPPAVQVQRPSTEQLPRSESTKENEGSEEVTTEKAAATGSLPEGEASTDANAESGLACSVCTDDFTKGQDVRVLPCNHKFHPECIDPWLLNVSGTCPLCRVDLRPTTSHPTDAEDQTDQDNLPHHPDSPNASTDHIDDPTPHDRRRSRTGLALYIQHTLNRRRMRDATPEERVAALRRLRTANQNSNNSTTNEASSDSDGTRNRLSARFSRAFNHDSRRGSILNPDASSRRGSAMAPNPNPTPNLNPNSESRIVGDAPGSRPVSTVEPVPENRRGSYAG